MIYLLQADDHLKMQNAETQELTGRYKKSTLNRFIFQKAGIFRTFCLNKSPIEYRWLKHSHYGESIVLSQTMKNSSGKNQIKVILNTINTIRFPPLAPNERTLTGDTHHILK